MKSKTLIIAMIVLTVLLVLSILLNIRQGTKLAEKQEHYENLIAQGSQNKVVDRYIKDSVTHTVFSEKLITNGFAEKQLAVGKTYTDSLQKALKISVEKISQATKINAQLEAKLALKDAPTDNGRSMKSYRDKNLTLDYFPDTDSVRLAMDITLNEARYSKRKWFFGAQQNYIDVFPDDPRITIKGLKSFTVKEKPPKRLGIGIAAGYGITQHDNTLRTTPYVGIGLNYNLIEF